ncbi:MAG: ATP-binding cassette domain-containing protein [Clostridiales bacterium]|nr:ATP-binding cassette domain-containing protein [Clostridiales bacterium]MCF8022925.1 ATP-binding cassette domain-containing protein [Clostridiales bacterium]
MAVIKIKNLTYYYPDIQKPALDNINMEILDGQFVLLAGSSGCGKSSLVRAICGLIPGFYGGTYGGSIIIDHDEVKHMERCELVKNVGMVFQDPESQLVMTCVEEELAFGLENMGLPNNLMKRRIMEVSSALGLSGCLHNYIPELSGGQKQKVALASVLVMQPEVLILDEPTSQLDPVAGEEILTLVKRLNEENGITVILVEQRLERCFHLADRVLVMEKGCIACDDIPQETARWAVRNESSFIPPLAKLFAGVNASSIPLTVKQGKQILIPYTHFPEIKRKKAPGKKQRKIQGKSLVDVHNLWFSYSNGKEVLKNINLKINPGDFTVIMGENAAGKSTFLKNINGLLKPGRGQVRVSGWDTKKVSVEELAPVCGYLSQDPNDYLFLDSVEQELSYTLDNLGLPDDGIIDDVMNKLQLTPYAESNPRDLSAGERQRVALASILVAKPELLLLDEPTRGLDYQLKEELGNIMKQLQAEGTAVIIITHDVEFAAEYAENIVLMAEGSIIAQGSKHEMLTGSTFYSPQLSKLFNNIIDGVVTLEQGKEALVKLMDSGENAVSG